MVRIVSGAPPEDAGLAFLAGYNNGTQQRRQAAEERRRQLGAIAEIQQVKMKLDAEKAKALAEANARAQLGDVQAMQQQDMERAAQGLPPEMQRLGEYAKLMQNLDDPRARKLATDTFHGLEQKIQEQKKETAFQEGLQSAERDGLLDPEGVQSYRVRRQAGEPPDNLLKEIKDAKDKRDAFAVNTQDAAEFITKAQARIAAAPPGRERKLAQLELQRLAGSPSAQEKPGTGAAMLANVEKILTGSQTRYPQLQTERTDAFNAQAAPGLQGMTVEQRNKQMMKEPHTRPLMPFEKRGAGGGPEVPPFQPTGPQAHATVKGGRGRKVSLPAIRRVLPTLIKETTSPKELADRLAAQGVTLTDEVQAEVRKALEGATNDARSQGSADR